MISKQKLLSLGKMALSCGLLYLLLRGVSWGNLGTALLSAQPEWFAFAFIAALIQIVVSAWRWQILLRLIGIEPLPLRSMIHTYFVSGFFNNFAPANLAGDAVRVSVVYQRGHSGLVAASSVILERLLNLAGLMGLCLWAMVVLPLPIVLNVNWLVIGTGAAVLTLLSGSLLWLWQCVPVRIRAVINKLHQIVLMIKQHPSLSAQILVLTMLLHLITMFVTFGTFQAVGLYLSVAQHLAIYAVAGLMITLPITIQGVGIREGVYIGIAGNLGMASEGVLAALALNYTILICLSLIGGLLFWLAQTRSIYKVSSQ